MFIDSSFQELYTLDELNEAVRLKFIFFYTSKNNLLWLSALNESSFKEMEKYWKPKLLEQVKDAQSR